VPIDSFKWLPPSLANYYKNLAIERSDVPWTPLTKPLSKCRFSLLSTAGIYVKGKQPPFDVERERREPTWGDPSYRAIPRDVRQEDVGVAHLHIKPDDLEADMNVALPIQRFLELEANGEIGSLAPTSYSVMGYQQSSDQWRDRYGPEIADRMKDEGIDCAFLTPV
jgi:D-proline reductase (dithiol) PrdB